MIVSKSDFETLNDHWAVSAIDADRRIYAKELSERWLVHDALADIVDYDIEDSRDVSVIESVAMAYEMAAIEGLPSMLHPANSEDSIVFQKNARAGAYHAFGLYRALPVPEAEDARIYHILHLSGLAYCGDRWTDLRRWFKDAPGIVAVPDRNNQSWEKRVLYDLFDCWVRLLRKDNWEDLSAISQIVLSLRNSQAEFESRSFQERSGVGSKCLAFQLVSLYHLARVTERLSIFILQGEPVAISAELDQHFEMAVAAAQSSGDGQLEVVSRWLHVTAKKMAEGSVWWVAHSINSRVSEFVRYLTTQRNMFELLPPQREALQEQGLLDQANRAVVVDMPTSGGKTQLAEFRILQALNQFSQDSGWVAYVAPTRALVSQITRRLRSDFAPLGINVEKLTGAIEIDSFEDDLLNDRQAFQVLVATPEKLQLVIRNKKIERPLSLVVMDEAQNIEDEKRGLRIELLLATIKQEVPRANFLLLMPFVPNSKDLAQWLAGERGKSISLSASAWKPNERVVGVFDIVRGGEKRGDWSLKFETLTTTQNTIHLRGEHDIGGNRPIALSYSNAKGVNALAASMAKEFSRRGTSIAVAGTIPDAWGMARKLSKSMPCLEPVPEEVALVKRFLGAELGADFELIRMLDRGIAVHHAGLPSEALSLIEWLVEEGFIRVLCATTTIAQGLNFPVSSVFLATTKYPYGIQMPHRAFWNLAGRAGRIDQGSVGVVGLAAGKDKNSIREYVSDATGHLVSRLEKLLDDLYEAEGLEGLTKVILQDQWADFRSYIAHLWNEKRNLDEVIADAELTLRNTYGFGALRSRANDDVAQRKADALLEATRNYARSMSEHPENATLADSTGFSPEGVRTALLQMSDIEGGLSAQDWSAESLFGNTEGSVLPELMGVLMRIPQMEDAFKEFKGEGNSINLAEVTRAWVSGVSLSEIADRFFPGEDQTAKISKACRAIYRDLSNSGAWGLSALSKMPTSGLDYENMSDEEMQKLNSLPAMLYHGVGSEEAVLMRMNSVPRSIAESLGREFVRGVESIHGPGSTKRASDFIASLDEKGWERLKPKDVPLSGGDYKAIWEKLSGW